MYRAEQSAGQFEQCPDPGFGQARIGVGLPDQIRSDSGIMQQYDLPFHTIAGARLQRGSDSRVRLPIIDRNGPDGNIFDSYSRAPYAVVLAAAGKTIYHSGVYTAIRRLRREEYTRRGWLHPEQTDPDFGEHDEHDDRALHLAVLKNTRMGAAVIASDRLIYKDEKSGPLPVEKKYPSYFEEHPIESGATEISRHLSRSGIPTERLLAEIASMRSMIGVGIAHGDTHAFGMIEPRLERLLKAKKINHQMLTDYEPTPEYGDTVNALLRVDPKMMLDQLRFRHVLKKDGIDLTTWLMFRNAISDQGIGFHSPYLLVNLGRRGLSQEVVHEGGIQEELDRYRTRVGVAVSPFSGRGRHRKPTVPIAALVGLMTPRSGE